MCARVLITAGAVLPVWNWDSMAVEVPADIPQDRMLAAVRDILSRLGARHTAHSIRCYCGNRVRLPLIPGQRTASLTEAHRGS